MSVLSKYKEENGMFISQKLEKLSWLKSFMDSCCIKWRVYASKKFHFTFFYSVTSFLISHFLFIISSFLFCFFFSSLTSFNSLAEPKLRCMFIFPTSNKKKCKKNIKFTPKIAKTIYKHYKYKWYIRNEKKSRVPFS